MAGKPWTLPHMKDQLANTHPQTKAVVYSSADIKIGLVLYFGSRALPVTSLDDQGLALIDHLVRFSNFRTSASMFGSGR